MRCPGCNTENPEGAGFCTQCATSLALRCPKCAFENPATAKFCAQCGTPLEATGPVRRTSEAGERLAGERRHLTVLFCDLVGSTEIASRLDPEEWREIVADYHRVTAQAIERFGGRVAQYSGDGVLAYFGWPAAHDNDPERAGRGGLAILEAISRLNERTSRPQLSVRIGIHSGQVVVGASAGKDADVFGDVPNIAARVQAAATSGTVLITEATHRLVSGLFVATDRGAQALKGIDRPIRLYSLIQPSGIRGRLEASAATRGLTPFVGREDELQVLRVLWEHVRNGEGQAALIVGEPGIGKSRLVYRFHEQIAETPHTWIGVATAPFFQNTPFYPILENLRRVLTRHGNGSAEDLLTRLEAALVQAGLNPAEAIPLIAPHLNLALTPKYRPPRLLAEQQRRRLMALLIDWALSLARVQPTVIATEDLHWADPSTLELIQLMVEQGRTAPVLLLYTARPEFLARWTLRPHHTQFTLNQLNARDARSMTERVAADKPLSEETVTAVLRRSGGVPLFVEELTRLVLERGDEGLTEREIPATLQDSLMARLDRLGPAKEILQVGAVIGSEFSYELIHTLHSGSEEHLQRALRDLVDAELLYVHGAAPNATYMFKHALIRDAAYEALLKSRRPGLHWLVAQTIDGKFPNLKEEHPEVLAHHWTEAGEAEPAVLEWSRAGKVAEARSAFKEALESYQRALELLGLLPVSRERDSRELKLWQSIVLMLYVTKGYAAPETINATDRATDLAERSGNRQQLINWATARCSSTLVSGDLPAAGTLANQALDLALRGGSSANLAAVYQLQIITRHMGGDLFGAEDHFAAGLQFFNDPTFRRVPAASVVGIGVASWNAWLLGRADVARDREAQMTAAINGNNPYDVAYAGYLAARLRLYLRENEQAETLAAEALELSEKNRLPYPTALSRIVLGQAQAELGHAREGIETIRIGIAGFLEAGARLGISMFTTYLATALLRQGAFSEALTMLEEAFRSNPGELVCQPEILRLRGELRRTNRDIGMAAADFREAIALARRMGARAWELRATMSLARLLATRRGRDEARTMLANMYGRFTEGFDTADLKEAKALLEQLSS